MKTNLSFITKEFIVLFLCTFEVMAQASKSTSMNKVIAESPYIVATEVTLQPGEKTDIHTHSAHFFYALTEGKLVVHYSDGKDEVFVMKPEESGVSDPERPHFTENTGNTTVKFLLVELKEHPYVETKKKK